MFILLFSPKRRPSYQVHSSCPVDKFDRSCETPKGSTVRRGEGGRHVREGARGRRTPRGDSRLTWCSVKFFPACGRFFSTPGETCRVLDMYGTPTPRSPFFVTLWGFPDIASMMSISVAPRPWFCCRSQCVVRSQALISCRWRKGGESVTGPAFLDSKILSNHVVETGEGRRRVHAYDIGTVERFLHSREYVLACQDTAFAYDIITLLYGT